VIGLSFSNDQDGRRFYAVVRKVLGSVVAESTNNTATAVPQQQQQQQGMMMTNDQQQHSRQDSASSAIYGDPAANNIYGAGIYIYIFFVFI
jgi:hypothetical protein